MSTESSNVCQKTAFSFTLSEVKVDPSEVEVFLRAQIAAHDLNTSPDDQYRSRLVGPFFGWHL